MAAETLNLIIVSDTLEKLLVVSESRFSQL